MEKLWLKCQKLDQNPSTLSQTQIHLSSAKESDFEEELLFKPALSRVQLRFQLLVETYLSFWCRKKP